MKSTLSQIQRASLLSLLLALLLISCKHKSQVSSKYDGVSKCLNGSKKASLGLINVQDSAVVQNLRLTGKVEYNPNAVVNYVSLVSGSVIQSLVSVGDKVQKGQILAIIKSNELNEMQAERRQLQSKLEVSKRNFTSVQGFYEDHIASEKELMTARSEKENLETELEKLENNLQPYQPGNEKNTFQIRAPRSGYMVANQLTGGGQVSAEGSPLFTISDMNEVWVNMNVYAADLDVVKVGDSITINAKSYPDKTFKGKIQQLSHILDPEENVVKARVVLRNDALLLKPGLFVEGDLKIKKETKMPRLTADAVVYHNDKYFVVVFVADCRLENREVEVVLQDEKNMYIKSGLKPGEEVVTQKALLHFENNQ